MAKGVDRHRQRYSGDEGAKRLLDRGLPAGDGRATGRRRHAHVQDARRHGPARRDRQVRHVPPQQLAGAARRARSAASSPRSAKGGRNWSNYTWHGDQAPGHPWVHGLQASDCDFNDLRFSKLIIMNGQEPGREQDAPTRTGSSSAWSAAPRSSSSRPSTAPPSTKADYWIPIRPATDAALFLGITRLMMDKKRVRRGLREAASRTSRCSCATDNLQAPARRTRCSRTTRRRPVRGRHLSRVQGLTEGAARRSSATSWSGTRRRTAPKAVTRDEVGQALVASGHRSGARGHGQGQAGGRQEVEVRPLWTLYQDPPEGLRPRHALPRSRAPRRS